jgi:hypothetical protein
MLFERKGYTPSSDVVVSAFERSSIVPQQS